MIVGFVFEVWNFVVEERMVQRVRSASYMDKVALKQQTLKLLQIDEKFYKIEGMEDRTVSGVAKFSKNGLRLSPTLMSNYGFTVGDKFKVSCLEEGEIVLEKK